MSEDITQGNLELWDLDEAIKQITHDGLLDTIEVMKQPNYFINQLIGSTLNKHAAETRIKGMFNIAIRLGQIKDPDTPSNWIEWAKRKGFDTDHLDHFKDIQGLVTTIGAPKKINAGDRNQSETGATKRSDNQVDAIVKQAIAFGYPPLSIPYGGKKKIKDVCLKDLNLFTDDGFDHAWKKAKKKGLIEVDNVNSYRKIS